MNKSFLYLLPVLLLTCGMFSSCAKEDDIDDTEIQRRSFDAWMKLYAPQAQKHESGIYIEILKVSSQDSPTTPVDNNWVYVNYTARNMINGDVAITRNADTARYQNTYKYYTHYAPEYLWVYPYNSTTRSDYYPCPGLYEALLMMSEGDIWRIYIPSDLAFGAGGYSNSGSGYEGNKTLPANTPIVYDLELTQIIEDAEAYELARIQEYALSVLDLGLRDTVANNLYYKSFGTIDPEGAKMAKDSSIKFYYTVRFLDGFVFDTNIPDTAHHYGFYQDLYKASYGDLETPMSYVIGKEADEGGMIAGVDSTFRVMSRGEYGRVIVPSALGYTNYGQFSTTSTSIPPFTPLIFDLELAPKNGNGTEKFPYDIQGIKALDQDVDGVWVLGFIVGMTTGNDATIDSLAVFDQYKKCDVRTNILISTTEYAFDTASCIPVELPEGTKTQQDLNLGDLSNKNLYTVAVKFYGNIRTYLNTKGLVDVSEYRILYW